MIINAYSIYDRKSGIYGNPFFSQNDETAKRDFTAFCAMPQNSYIAPDLELYAVCSFDSSTGEVMVGDIGKPVFLTNFVVKE